MEQVDFYDIYGYHYVGWWQKTPFKIFITLFTLLCVGIVVWCIVIFIKKRFCFFKPLSTAQWAYEQIKSLREQIPDDKTKYKFFYFALTSFVKEYFYRRYGWRTQDKTDKELVVFLLENDFDKDLLEDLMQLFGGIIELKFANAQVFQERARKDLTVVKNLIEQTKQRDNE